MTNYRTWSIRQFQTLTRLLLNHLLYRPFQDFYGRRTGLDVSCAKCGVFCNVFIFPSVCLFNLPLEILYIPSKVAVSLSDFFGRLVIICMHTPRDLVFQAKKTLYRGWALMLYKTRPRMGGQSGKQVSAKGSDQLFSPLAAWREGYAHPTSHWLQIRHILVRECLPESDRS